MIIVEISWRAGDRPAPTISDDLISTESVANVRARQELAKHLNINKGKTIKQPHEPETNVGDTRTFAFSRLGIWGDHHVSKLSISLGIHGHYDTLVIEQYGVMP